MVNLKRGLFRCWLVFAVVWVGYFAVDALSQIGKIHSRRYQLSTGDALNDILAIQQSDRQNVQQADESRSTVKPGHKPTPPEDITKNPEKYAKLLKQAAKTGVVPSELAKQPSTALPASQPTQLDFNSYVSGPWLYYQDLESDRAKERVGKDVALGLLGPTMAWVLYFVWLFIVRGFKNPTKEV